MEWNSRARREKAYGEAKGVSVGTHWSNDFVKVNRIQFRTHLQHVTGMELESHF